MNIIVILHLLHHIMSDQSSQETLFGRIITPAERLRQHQRSLAKAQRELDRERTKLEQSEKKLVIDIKKAAKAGQLVCLLTLPSLYVQECAHWRMLVKLWPRILSELDVTHTSFIKCEPNCRPLGCGYKLWEVISRWQRPCEGQLGYRFQPFVAKSCFHYRSM